MDLFSIVGSGAVFSLLSLSPSEDADIGPKLDRSTEEVHTFAKNV
jgi:hypothetical protein